VVSALQTLRRGGRGAVPVRITSLGAQAVSRPWIEPVRSESQLRRSVTEATARIQEIIDAAERVAEEIRADAEAEASRYLDERKRDADRLAEEQARRLSELSDLLAERARYVREQVEALTDALERTVANIRAGTTPPAAAETEPPVAGEEREAPPQTSVRDSGGVEEPLLRATQMAVGGSERGEIERTLRREFGVEEPNAIVDRILGPPGG
jgi:hypothetical protein